MFEIGRISVTANIIIITIMSCPFIHGQGPVVIFRINNKFVHFKNDRVQLCFYKMGAESCGYSTRLLALIYIVMEETCLAAHLPPTAAQKHLQYSPWIIRTILSCYLFVVISRVLIGFMKSTFPYHLELLHWQRGNCMIPCEVTLQNTNPIDPWYPQWDILMFQQFY